MTEARRDLPQLLGEARRWFEDGLLAALEAGGVPAVTPAQVQLFAALGAEGATVAELARRVGVTRQTVHQAVRSLIAAGLLEQIPDPASARQRLVRRTPAGRYAHDRARRALGRLEARLAERIGEEALAALRSALEAPWGDPPGRR
ncbi:MULTISPECIES: MarR family transcriptional regulator [unclassified Streptomyces]|uniref:MarR family winged helix-turn-helix transcriptional regulator n=1 Tax=unclassified Streptomyces TaxID=2593676 RepID=UPI000DBA94EB|nr:MULTISPECIES: MarR family transcriptional regulator [unclassified Streptomyces]MYT74845.1 MarR family transcriptional regulator [Streptomyces sp. SID8367]RAJ91832.1 DNA-binding MarR family transcriptional regulator [Streptomyces sp. PsTaAH-137]